MLQLIVVLFALPYVLCANARNSLCPSEMSDLVIGTDHANITRTTSSVRVGCNKPVVLVPIPGALEDADIISVTSKAHKGQLSFIVTHCNEKFITDPACYFSAFSRWSSTTVEISFVPDQCLVDESADDVDLQTTFEIQYTDFDFDPTLDRYAADYVMQTFAKHAPREPGTTSRNVTGDELEKLKGDMTSLLADAFKNIRSVDQKANESDNLVAYFNTFADYTHTTDTTVYTSTNITVTTRDYDGKTLHVTTHTSSSRTTFKTPCNCTFFPSDMPILVPVIPTADPEDSSEETSELEVDH